MDQDGYVSVSASDDVSAVVEFELLYHQILEIINFVNHVIGIKYIGYL